MIVRLLPPLWQDDAERVEGLVKVTVEIECTPEEARQFFGLPDVKPMQDAMMAKVETQMIEAVDRFSPDSVLRNWLALGPQSADTMRDMFDRFLKTGRS